MNNTYSNLINKVNTFKTNPYEMWLMANGYQRNKSGNINEGTSNNNPGAMYIPNFHKTQKYTPTSAADIHHKGELDLMDVRPSTVVHRNRTSPFNKNKHLISNKNLNTNDLTRADSKDIKTRSKSRNNNNRNNKLIREDLEWFNSNASTEQHSDDFGYKHI